VLHSYLRLLYVDLLKAKQFERNPSATVDFRFTKVLWLTMGGDWFREKRGDPSGLPPLAIGCFPWWCRVVKPPLRTKTLSTKVSEEELAQLEAAASERGLTPSEWCRETLLASVNGQEPKACDPGGTGHAVMAELVALRAILLNVLFKQANGQTLTAEEMQRLIDKADSDKLRKARERLWQAQESEGQRKEKS
jgi:hypothetical protein